MSTAIKKLPTRVKLAEALRVLGISRRTFHRYWGNAFTPFTTDGGQHLIASDELTEAAKYSSPDKARGAVKLLRTMLGRIEK